jgi:enamine deaminase RidA (YjgF/YER057c/UK114 family)
MYLCDAVTVDTEHARFVFLSGATAVDASGTVVGVGDTTAQTRQALRNIDAVMREAGGTIDDVVRLRIYVGAPLRPTTLTEVHAARSEVFGVERCPASTFVAVSALAGPDLLVEIEADGVVEVG